MRMPTTSTRLGSSPLCARHARPTSAKLDLDTDQARTLWHKGFKDQDQFTTLTTNAIYRHLDGQPRSLLLRLRPSSPSVRTIQMIAMIASKKVVKKHYVK